MDDFDEVLESMSKEELNNLIDEISNMDTGGEPTISEYFTCYPPIIDEVE